MRNQVIFISLLIFVGLITTFSSLLSTNQVLDLEYAYPNLNFNRPIDLQVANDDSNRMFVAEQAGLIYYFENEVAVNSRTLFLDIQDRVHDSGNEQGLLGLAFHPDYINNSYFYVYYTTSSTSKVSRFSVSSEDGLGNKTTELEILEVNQPFSNHNGGQIAFGPDGFLYIALGDGGSGGDPQGHGQNLQTLLGSILRIDVDSPENGNDYGIPSDNPFQGNSNGYMEEIYAYGLRNPWRMSIDPFTSQIWVGDVGQSSWEEVDLIESGKNYGWNIMEGAHCFEPSTGCDDTNLVYPVTEYGRSEGTVITGGYVYYGSNQPSLNENYIFADFGSGRIWAIPIDIPNPSNNLLMDTDLAISSFGTDDSNELYILAFDGNIYKFETDTSVTPTPSTISSTVSSSEGMSSSSSEGSSFSESSMVESGSESIVTTSSGTSTGIPPNGATSTDSSVSPANAINYPSPIAIFTTLSALIITFRKLKQY